MKLTTRISPLALLICGTLILASGCKKDEAPQPPAGDDTAAKAPDATVPPAVTDAADAVAKLVRADEQDGTADKVIGKCVMCGLRMDGTPDYTSSHAGYTLHFCSADCKQHFDDGPAAAIAALNVTGE